MNKKIFAGLLFLISLIVLAGGCGGGGGSVTNNTDVDAALNGAWLSSNSGNATIASTNDDADELEEFTKAFGEIPEDVLQQYKEMQADKTEEFANVPVTRAMLFFENSNISKSSGTAKLTGLVIVSNDTIYLPIYFNGVELTTTRGSSNTWTATTANGGSLSITMDSEEKINLSGTISYLEYNCEFSTTIEKSQANSIDPEKILDGTWSLDGTQSGGCLAYSSEITAAAVPETASISFTKNSATNSWNVASSHILWVKTSNIENDDSLALLQKVNPAAESKLEKISDNIYKLTDTSGNENIIFFENTDQIFVIKNESEDNSIQTSVFLPLKKAEFDIETILNKTWTASEGNGGGWIHFDDISSIVETTDENELEFLKILQDISFSLTTASLKFSDATANDDGTISTTMNLTASFPITTEIFKTIFPSEYQAFEAAVNNATITMTQAGNSLKFEYDDDVYNASFISENELILSVETAQEGEGYGQFVMKFQAN